VSSPSEPRDVAAFAFHDVGPTSVVGPGETVAFEAGDRRFIVCNTGDRLYAVAERCTHAAWSLAGSALEGFELICSLHGARFDLRTGAATGLPASKPLRTFPVKTSGGRILVALPPPVV
jgi:3-phenylpropionate/trans-cinnamate dioxygenase ferredoxin subunit